MNEKVQTYSLLAIEMLWHVLAAGVMTFQVDQIVKLYERHRRKARELDRMQTARNRQIYVSAETRRRLRTKARVVDKTRSRLNSSGILLLANIASVYLLGNRLALDFNRVVKLFVMSTIGNLGMRKYHLFFGR